MLKVYQIHNSASVAARRVYFVLIILSQLVTDVWRPVVLTIINII